MSNGILFYDKIEFPPYSGFEDKLKWANSTEHGKVIKK